MIPPIKYFLYARKSNKNREKQILSIPSQVAVLRRLAEQQSLSVVGEITERESAHLPGRPEFNKMLRRIERGDANGILAWHPDRLARNGLDGGTVVTYLDCGKLVDLKFATFWFENTPQGKSNLGHEFVQTKQYSDKLACDTRRGLQSKARMGFFPGRAPLGYLNDRGTKTVVIDPQTAPIVKEVFETFAKGDKTLDDMREFLASRGVVTRLRSKGSGHLGGLKVHVDLVRRLLRNPFYYGDFKYADEVFEGRHAAIVSKQLFDNVQRVLARRTRPVRQERIPKAFTRLLRCSGCQMAITAEIQKGHVYYRCTGKSRIWRCSQKYIREEELERQLTGLLLEYALEPQIAEEMLALANVDHRECARSAELLVEKKRSEIAKNRESLERLTSIYLAQDINRELFLAKKEELLSTRRVLSESIEQLESDPSRTWLEPFANWLKTAQRLGKIASSGSPQEKKQAAAEIFGSNLFLDSKKASGCATKPWSLITKFPSIRTVVPLYNAARSHFERGGDPEGLPTPFPCTGREHFPKAA